MKKARIKWLNSQGSSVVGHLSHNPEVKGSNPVARTRREKMEELVVRWLTIKGSTVVEHLSYNPEVNVLNPAASTKREKKA